ncbi:MAG: DUF3224 domain-containing protein [Blastocatellia bacterium AA13]|nr:MAG: DUF3224 domain-containing protein [Blastocatellia bacterium AA13]
MSTHATGTFEVKLTPQQDGLAVGRLTIEKQYHGDLEGTSSGQMLAMNTSVQGSAGYVAMERVSGTLQGRTGTFALQHSGTMNRGEPQLSVTVVPDSGTEQFAGISGKLNIIIAEGKHSYEFDYSIEENS